MIWIQLFGGAVLLAIFLYLIVWDRDNRIDPDP